MSEPVVEELLRLNQRLLESIAAGDWAVYEELCDPSLTAFEPEAAGHRHHHPFEILARRRRRFYDTNKPNENERDYATPEIVHPAIAT